MTIAKSTMPADISAAEWEVMRMIWTLKEATSHNVISALQAKTDWRDSTIKTLLSRLMQKGYLQREGQQRPFHYVATISEQTGINQQVDSLFAGLCAHHVGPTILRLIETQTISKADLAAIKAVVTQQALTAPETVACDCLTDCQPMNEKMEECNHD